MKKMIFIPTRGRIGKQLTYKCFSENFIKEFNVTLVCPEDELRRHLRLGFDAIACPLKGISPTRQWIMGYARDRNIKTVMMMDDDLEKWGIRRSQKSYHLRPATKDFEIEGIIRAIFELGRTYKLAGISERAGNNRFFPEEVVECTRQTRLHVIDTRTFFKIGARFDIIPLMEDFCVTLRFLTHGYKNAIFANYTIDSTSHVAGGCQGYRNNDLQEKAANRLKELYPDFVTVVERSVKSGWEGMKTRTDVRVQWVKAYKSSFKKD